MKISFIATTTAVLAMALVSPVASAALVQVTDVATGDASEALFGTNIAQTGVNGEILTLELNDFIADDTELGLVPVTVTDSITMTLTAPESYRITSLTYVESGTAETNEGVVTLTGSITVGGEPVNFDQVVISGDSRGQVSWDLQPISIALLGGVDSVAVTITNTLFAIGFEPSAIATMEKTDTVLSVGITPIPVPAAVWLFGSALGLLGWMRRKAA